VPENYIAWGKLAVSIQWSERANSALTGDGAGPVGDSVQAGRVLRVQGAIARLQGNLELAGQFLLDSAEIFSAALEKLESARTAYELALLANDVNETERAQEYFNQAREIYIDVGAKMELQRVDTGLQNIAV
jgi:tetratricopeptide (TPR) repeat protein